MPARRATPESYRKARLLRKEPTPVESRLWDYLRNNNLNGVKFRRQHAIGNFIVDFCSLKHKLIIEVDGNQHLEQTEYDTERTAYLRSKGYYVLRFWNHEIMNNISGVIRTIASKIDE